MQAQIHSKSLEMDRLRREVKDCRAVIIRIRKKVQDGRAEIDRTENVGKEYTLLMKKRASESRRVSKQSRGRHVFSIITLLIVLYMFAPLQKIEDSDKRLLNA